MSPVRKLVILSLLGTAGVGAMIWLRLGWHQLRSSGQRLDPTYLAKRDLIAPLQRIRGQRPFTSQEMELLKKFARDPDKFIRCRALSALRDVRDPQQRQEAIKIALERLKDPEWVVRNYAMRVIAAQGAKEYVSQILPLLNDPQPEVREEAKKTLQKLGYQVSE
ncbi:MAG: HEAT repeat domain-containing protein [Armatimonadota bacterium]|nr:HEAT repeat domain-containing protein [Armatimonadota bacterium]MDW8143390.1 HEAT repeat domain-containing protein [Armatimonadota bacterium]